MKPFHSPTGPTPPTVQQLPGNPNSDANCALQPRCGLATDSLRSCLLQAPSFPFFPPKIAGRASFANMVTARQGRRHRRLPWTVGALLGGYAFAVLLGYAPAPHFLAPALEQAQVEGSEGVCMVAVRHVAASRKGAICGALTLLPRCIGRTKALTLFSFQTFPRTWHNFPAGTLNHPASTQLVAAFPLTGSWMP